MNTQLKLNVNCHVVTDVYTAPGPSQKKDISPGVADCHLKNYKLKSVKSVSCVTQLSCVNPASNVINAVPNLPVGARLQNFWQTWLDLGAGPKIVQNPERGLHPSLSDPAKSYKVSDCRKLLCQSPQEQLPVGGITSAYEQKCRTGLQSNIAGVFQSTFSSPKTQQQVEANTGSKQTKPLSQGGEIQNGDTGNHQNIPPTRGVGHLGRLQGCLLPHTNTGTIQEISTSSRHCPLACLQHPWSSLF